MRYHALACDYDGTLARNGVVDDSVVAALRRCRKSGRRVLLVTGRELADLSRVFGHLDLFDCVVAENGATLYLPATGEENPLVPPPPAEFAAVLKSRGVGPISVGRVIVATWTPHETTVLETIRDLGLELQVIFNKGAVMVLPSGVNKASGLSTALDHLGLSRHNTVAIGDAENDHALLQFAEAGVAVANAVPTLLERADLVTAGDHGTGVIELVDRLLETDLCEIEPRLTRHDLLIGSDEDRAREIRLSPYRTALWVAAPSTAALEQVTRPLQYALAAAGRQFCVIAARGVKTPPANAIVLGSSGQAPDFSGLRELIGEPRRNVVVDLSAVSSDDWAAHFTGICDLLHEERRKSGRPHWLFLHETPRLRSLPEQFDPDKPTFDGLVVATVEPADARRDLLDAFKINAVIQSGSCSPEDWNLLRSALPLDIPPLSATPGASPAVFWSQAAGEPRAIDFTTKPLATRPRPAPG